mmetsp:Transcript_14057/g.44905  ORF Transcript_14057/g.44905 Transcript_14057/m.44905 type:complete len:506 (+) Transcript_14057:390-1907(+)
MAGGGIVGGSNLNAGSGVARRLRPGSPGAGSLAGGGAAECGLATGSVVERIRRAGGGIAGRLSAGNCRRAGSGIAVSVGGLGDGSPGAGGLGAGSPGAGGLGAGSLGAGSLGASSRGAGGRSLSAGGLRAGSLGAGGLGAGGLGAGSLQPRRGGALRGLVPTFGGRGDCLRGGGGPIRCRRWRWSGLQQAFQRDSLLGGRERLDLYQAGHEGQALLLGEDPLHPAKRAGALKHGVQRPVLRLVHGQEASSNEEQVRPVEVQGSVPSRRSQDGERTHTGAAECRVQGVPSAFEDANQAARLVPVKGVDSVARIRQGGLLPKEIVRVHDDYSRPVAAKQHRPEYVQVERIHVHREDVDVLWNLVLRHELHNVVRGDVLLEQADALVLMAAVEVYACPAQLAQEPRVGLRAVLGAKLEILLVGRLHILEDVHDDAILVVLRVDPSGTLGQALPPAADPHLRPTLEGHDLDQAVEEGLAGLAGKWQVQRPQGTRVFEDLVVVPLFHHLL